MKKILGVKIVILEPYNAVWGLCPNYWESMPPVRLLRLHELW